MIITDRQFAVFEVEQWQRFENDVIAYLGECFGSLVTERNQDSTDLRLMIREGIRRAQRYQLRGEAEITRFVAYEFEYGVEFHSLPWAAPILEAADLSEEEKMERLEAIYVFDRP